MASRYGRITRDMMDNKLEFYHELYTALTQKKVTIRIENTAMNYYHVFASDNATIGQTIARGTYSEVYSDLVAACDTMRRLRDNM